MIITIRKGYTENYVILTCTRHEFYKRYGNKYILDNRHVYKELAKISSWVNNELGEECLFEVD